MSIFLNKHNIAIINKTLYNTHVSKFLTKETIKDRESFLQHAWKKEENAYQMVFNTDRDNINSLQT